MWLWLWVWVLVGWEGEEEEGEVVVGWWGLARGGVKVSVENIWYE